MLKPTLAGAALLLALTLPAPGLRAEDPPKPGEAAKPAAAAPAPHRPALPADVTTHHEIAAGGRKLAYTATAGTLPLVDDKGETIAHIFYVSFTLDGANPAARPVSYLFNGGPGAASAYLDIGAVGPRVIDFGPTGAVPPPSDRVIDNPDTWLAFTDLVFIDPVGTGYSYATGGAEAAKKEFWGVEPDLKALGTAIRLHLTRSGRSGSPIYIVGESYGGFRAARLALALNQSDGISPAGVLMVSPVIDFNLMGGGPTDLLNWALRVPSYVAAAQAAKGETDPAALAAAEQFVLTDYLTALAAGKGDQALYDKLAQVTGMDPAMVARWDGRIPLDGYLREMRRLHGRVVSRYDTTVTDPDSNPFLGYQRDDPVLDGSRAAFIGGFTAYVRDDLGFKTDRPFEILSGEVAHQWNWETRGRGPGGTLGSSQALARALAIEPRLKVLIAHGIEDLQTPYMMSRYVKAHMPGALGDRIALKLYEGGHMLYLHNGSRRRLHDDAQAFYAAAPAK